MNNELRIRMDKIRQQLIQEGIEACLISTNVNLIYTTGGVVNGFHYIPAVGSNQLYIRRPIGIQQEQVTYIRKPEDIPGLLLEAGYTLPKSMLVEAGEMSHTDWLRLQACFPSTTLLNGTNLLRNVRSIKTDYECELIRASARAHAASYSKIPSLFRPGMTDIEFSIEIEHLMRQEGDKGLFRTFGDMEAYFGSVLTGDNAATPSPYDFALGGAGDSGNPVGANGSILKEGNTVMVDMCGNYSGYLDDLTRTYTIGKVTEKAYRAHQVAIDIINQTQDFMKEGVVCEDVYNLALSMAQKAGLADCFMGTVQQAKFIGHGLGLVINEPPVLAIRSQEVLLQNMALAVEPKFVIEGVGAVGLEDTFIIGRNNSEKITLLEPNMIDLLNY